jgi:hypothetical protein
MDKRSRHRRRAVGRDAEGEANISMDKRSRHRRRAVGRDAEEANMATRDEEMI